mmetsp:Transcript_2841/g.4235  ORF Transcript_2841/g.4235 Transcript_2841/m.4235 type:complete len:132 (-) Transcript_2841:154-549(-)
MAKLSQRSIFISTLTIMKSRQKSGGEQQASYPQTSRRSSCPTITSLSVSDIKQQEAASRERTSVVLSQGKKEENASPKIKKTIRRTTSRRRVSTDLYEELRKQGVDKQEAKQRQKRLSKLKRSIGYFDDDE